MKQKFPLAVFFLLVFASFLSVNRVSACTIGAECQLNNTTKGICGNTFIEGESVTTCLPAPTGGGGTTTGSKCYDSFGTEVVCTYNPATGTPLSGSTIGTACVVTGSEAGTCTTESACRANGNPGFASVAPCVSQGLVCCRTVTSPVPGASGGAVTPPTASNRVSAPVTGGTARGLYIPRGSEVGLSEMSVTSLIRNLLNWLLYIVGFVAIIAFVISGMQYLMAGADEEMAKKGKANMTYAIIGVLVALSALIIIRAIQSVLSGSWNF